MNQPEDYIHLKNLPERASRRRKIHKRLLKKLPQRDLIERLPEFDEAAFEQINCLSCANCCKHYSPRFKPPDIKRISRRMKMKEKDFIAQYLQIDDDGDHVLQTTPCPFLAADNRCSIYEDRPRDCARYPYTAEDVLVKQPALTLKNATCCPAVFNVLERIAEAFDR